jgi:2-polyprenyl-3-methyl-5-hydroxy-6-metoxy-1,4-benzoquinol methylase
MKLSEKEDWENRNYYSSEHRYDYLPRSFYSAELARLVSKYVKPRQSLIEVGAAPGRELVRLAKSNGFVPYGIEYSSEGIEAARSVFRSAGYDPQNLVEFDFFEDEALLSYSGKFDAVLSRGFVEHFEDVQEVIRRHLLLLKPGGVAFITVPNYGLYGQTWPEHIREIHNLNVLSSEGLRAAADVESGEILECGYFGGIFNVGSFYAETIWGRVLKKGFLLCQRITLDLLQRVLPPLQNRLLSPGVYIVLRRCG